MSLPVSPKTHGSDLPQLAADNLSKTFVLDGGVLAVLQGIAFEVHAGEILAILGKSGVGKTSLLNLLSGLEAPSSGTVSRTGTVGYVPQKDLLLSWRTVLENVLLPIELQQGDLAAATTRARALLRAHGLEPFERAYPAEISGGMRQKVSLIRTLLQDPQIILFDEPFSAIDFDARLTLVKEMRALIRQQRKIAIFVTHNIEEAIAISDQLIVLHGRPATMVHQVTVQIAEESRDPVSVRQTKEFHTLFEDIWGKVATESV